MKHYHADNRYLSQKLNTTSGIATYPIPRDKNRLWSSVKNWPLDVTKNALCKDENLSQWRIWGDQNFFNFMGFFRKCINILGRRPQGGAFYDKSWIRPRKQSEVSNAWWYTNIL